MARFALFIPLTCSIVALGTSLENPLKFGKIKHDYEEIKHGLKALTSAFVHFSFTNGTIVDVTYLLAQDSSTFPTEQAYDLAVSYEEMLPLVSSVADHATEKKASFSQLGNEVVTFVADELAQLAADISEFSYEFSDKCPLEIKDEVETTAKSIEAVFSRSINVFVPQ
ncbi:hypothetical protein BU17DRAFT_64093 [Hysterangium stoloniferum]|nr:hypothetical protein BU17DRAFT_64093 [Hysterangium stoloniferum]